MAELALKQMGITAKITQNTATKQYVVEPNNPNSNFKNAFLDEYAVQVATKKAKAEGYSVSRTVENGEIVLTLRQY